jgi:hypothetical protein
LLHDNDSALGNASPAISMVRHENLIMVRLVSITCLLPLRFVSHGIAHDSQNEAGMIFAVANV